MNTIWVTDKWNVARLCVYVIVFQFCSADIEIVSETDQLAVIGRVASLLSGSSVGIIVGKIKFLFTGIVMTDMPNEEFYYLKINYLNPQNGDKTGSYWL